MITHKDVMEAFKAIRTLKEKTRAMPEDNNRIRYYLLRYIEEAEQGLRRVNSVLYTVRTQDD